MFEITELKAKQAKSITITEKVIKENKRATIKYEIQKS